MSTIKPFAGIRYNTTSEHDISTRLSPPYDILDRNDKQRLLDADPINFVKIDLPHLPPKSAGPQTAYSGARDTFDAWLADGTVVKDPQPALYVYHQVYRHGSTDYVRKMFFARLRLEPFGEGSIFPHERTFGGPKEDRLALTKATQTNLSPIFGLYEDTDNRVATRLEEAIASEPTATGTFADVENRLWAMTDPAAIADVAQMMTTKPIYIADGHHRCGTAMLYRDWLTERQGPLPDDHPANFVLCVFCAMEDPGLLILPTHRLLPGIRIPDGVFTADGKIELKSLDASDPAQAIAALKNLGPQAICAYDGSTQTYKALRPTAPEILDNLEPDHSRPWRRLGLAFLHAYVLDRVVTPSVSGGTAPEIRYIKSDADAIKLAQETDGTSFLMQPTTMEELRAVCSAGDLMPQKSTYFYPKLASGLVVNPLTE